MCPADLWIIGLDVPGIKPDGALGRMPGFLGTEVWSRPCPGLEIGMLIQAADHGSILPLHEFAGIRGVCAARHDQAAEHYEHETYQRDLPAC